MRLHQPREAIAYLSPALRGPVEAQNLYVSRIELHELLAKAWDAAGQRGGALQRRRSGVGSSGSVAQGAGRTMSRESGGVGGKALDGLTA